MTMRHDETNAKRAQSTTENLGAVAGLRGLHASPPDPLELQATAWRLYGAFLDTARMARDAFGAAGLEMPMPIADAISMANMKAKAKAKW